MNNWTLPIWYFFPTQVPTELHRTVFPTRDQRVCPYKFRSRGTTGSSMSDQDLGHFCRGRRIHNNGHSDFWILSNLGASSSFTRVYADTASAACPAQSGSLAMTFISFAAVIRNADEPCSVNTASDPEPYLTMSPRSTSLPLYFWYFGFDSAFLRWQMSINLAKWTFFLSLCASRMTSFILFTLDNCHAGSFSSFSHSLSTAAFASHLRHMNTFVHQIERTDWLEPFFRDVIFMIFWLSRFQTLSRGLMSLHDACWLCLWDFVGTFSFVVRLPRLCRTILRSHFTRHSRLHRYLQLFLAFFMVSLYSPSSGSTKQMPLNFRALSSFGLSTAHCCFFFSLICFWEPNFRPRIMRSGCCFNLCRPPPGPQVSLREVFRSIEWTSWILSKNLTNFDRHRHANGRQYDFLATHPDSCA